LLQHGKFQHNILEIGAPVYELPAYYAGTPTHGKFQHNILEIGAPVYELPAYYVGTSTHYEISCWMFTCEKFELQHIMLEYFSYFEQFT